LQLLPRDAVNPFGVLIEQSSTNSIRNNMMVGAVAASSVQLANNGTFSTTSPNVCPGSVTSGSNTLARNNGYGTGGVGTINSGSGSISATTGSMTRTGGGTNAASIYEAITTVSGYIYTIAVTTGSGNEETVQAGTTSGGSTLLAASTAAASATTSVQLTAAGTTSYVQINNASASAATVTVVLVKSAGHLRTNWGYNLGAPAVPISVVGTGTENGINYTDLNFSGTAAITGGSCVSFESANIIAAAQNQVWTNSTCIKSISGTIPTTTLEMSEDSGAPAFLADDSSTAQSVTSGGLGTNRISYTATASQATTAYVFPDFAFNMAGGVSVNFIAHIGMPQMEQVAVPTSVIPTYGSAVTRAGDVFSVPTTAAGTNGAWYTTGVGTLGSVGAIPYYASSGSSGFRFFVTLNDGTINNRPSNFVSPSTGGTRAVDFIAGGTTVYAGEISSPVYTAGATCKEVLAFQADNQGAAIDGTILTDGTIASTPAFSQLNIGAILGANDLLDGWVNRIWYVPTPQPDAGLPDYTQ